MKLALADISTNAKQRLVGFKIVGLLPYYLKYITVKTHIQLCRVRVEIQSLTPEGKEPSNEDFYDADLQEKIMPLVQKYCLIGLLNNRNFSWLIKPFLNRKLKNSSHFHIWNLYFTLFKLNEPAFFLSYWKAINQKETTLLKEATQ